MDLQCSIPNTLNEAYEILAKFVTNAITFNDVPFEKIQKIVCAIYTVLKNTDITFDNLIIEIPDNLPFDALDAKAFFDYDTRSLVFNRTYLMNTEDFITNEKNMITSDAKTIFKRQFYDMIHDLWYGVIDFNRNDLNYIYPEYKAKFISLDYSVYSGNDELDDIYYISVHECGHILEASFRYFIDDWIRELKNNSVRLEDIIQISLKSFEHPAELFAEITALIALNKKKGIPHNLINAYENLIRY